MRRTVGSYADLAVLALVALGVNVGAWHGKPGFLGRDAVGLGWYFDHPSIGKE
jgi:hypothetical protein